MFKIIFFVFVGLFASSTKAQILQEAETKTEAHTLAFKYFPSRENCKILYFTTDELFKYFDNIEKHLFLKVIWIHDGEITTMMHFRTIYLSNEIRFTKYGEYFVQFYQQNGDCSILYHFNFFPTDIPTPSDLNHERRCGL